MKIEIWSDVICPFCYLGKKHLEIALNEFSFQDNIVIEWKSFQLNPSLPSEGLDISTEEYLVQRKGMPHQQVQAMMEHLQQSGNKVGIDFRQDISIQANTFKAHRLIHYAQHSNMGSDMEEALFKAHFSQGKNIGKDEVLIDLAVSIGLERDAVSNFIKSNDLYDEVIKDINEARELGISGVPFFVIDREYAISGAQPVEIFINTLREAKG